MKKYLIRLLEHALAKLDPVHVHETKITTDAICMSFKGRITHDEWSLVSATFSAHLKAGKEPKLSSSVPEVGGVI